VRPATARLSGRHAGKLPRVKPCSPQSASAPPVRTSAGSSPSSAGSRPPESRSPTPCSTASGTRSSRPAAPSPAR